MTDNAAVIDVAAMMSDVVIKVNGSLCIECVLHRDHCTKIFNAGLATGCSGGTYALLEGKTIEEAVSRVSMIVDMIGAHD